ncbi:MAG TPA: sodium:solute symporter family protein [Candidatus Avamphibacillus intestinigallinarum]|nr:sodium:solute symporter family protein [Candidatus Avamphibacillus intestinigallinarum]
MFTGEQKVLLASIVVIYFIFLFVLSLYMNRKTKTYDDYNVAGRTVSVFPLILTFVGTGVGGATLLGYMENGFSMGMGQQWIHITMFFAVILLVSFFLKRIRQLGEEHHMVTIGDYTALRYGEKARIPTVISFLFSYCAMTGMQFVAIASILNLTIGLNMTLGILIGWALLTVKTYLGGLKAVIWQDVIHGTILTLGVILLFFTVLKFSGSWQSISATATAANEGDMLNVFNITTNEIMIYLLTLAFYQFIRQDVWQRIWAAKNLKTARNGYWISMIIAVALGAIIVAIGVYSRYGLGLENADPALIYYSVIEHVFPFSLVVVMIIVLMAAVISSADSFFVAGSSSIVNDIIKPNVKDPDNTKMLLYSKLSVLIVSAIALVLALAIPGLVNLMVTGTAMSVSALLAPVVFGMFWKRVTQIAGIASMWGGLLVAVIWQILGHPFDVHPILVGLPVSIVTLLVVTMFTKQQPQNGSSTVQTNVG